MPGWVIGGVFAPSSGRGWLGNTGCLHHPQCVRAPSATRAGGVIGGPSLVPLWAPEPLPPALPSPGGVHWGPGTPPLGRCRPKGLAPRGVSPAGASRVIPLGVRAWVFPALGSHPLLSGWAFSGYTPGVGGLKNPPHITPPKPQPRKHMIEPPHHKPTQEPIQ